MPLVKLSDDGEWIHLMHELSLQRLNNEILKLKKENGNLRELIAAMPKMEKVMSKGNGK